MNREILFRGFHKDENGRETIYLNGEEIKGNWVYGSLISNVNKTNRYFIVEDVVYTYTNDDEIINQIIDDKVEVIQETVGQYVGLNDESGKNIFENDIVFYSDFTSIYKYDITGVVKYTHDCMFEIEYDDKYIKDRKETRPLVCHEHSIFAGQKTKVIGTIFDKEVK